jgi:hypothetical protein
MTAADRVIRFPARRYAAVWILEQDGGWLVLARNHGWLHGDRRAALTDAVWLSRNLGLPVRGAP